MLLSEQGANSIVWHSAPQLPVHVPPRHFMVFPVQRVDAVLGEDHVVVSLIGINHRRSYARVRVHASDDEAVAADMMARFFSARI